ncbi:hypothetical protein KUTeg_018054 [Tegillarca granosa]|uniref:Uncharacterized protein n=1 Tax=Tegillarca granosa TaxID=220873 RepID=A0ABQ9EJ80_TEGGR|nr:hypothetical protein KUTeg_018054 [Tegillarca granosa]
MLFVLLMSLSFVQSYIAFAMRFFIGAFLERDTNQVKMFARNTWVGQKYFLRFSHTGFALICDKYIMEIFPKKCRGRVSAAGAMFWSFAAMLLTPFAYFLRNYSRRFLDESLRWLVANGKVDSATSYKKMATNSLTYYGLTLTSSTFARNRFLNYFLSCAVEFPGEKRQKIYLDFVPCHCLSVLNNICCAVSCGRNI